MRQIQQVGSSSEQLEYLKSQSPQQTHLLDRPFLWALALLAGAAVRMRATRYLQPATKKWLWQTKSPAKAVWAGRKLDPNGQEYWQATLHFLEKATLDCWKIAKTPPQKQLSTK